MKKSPRNDVENEINKGRKRGLKTEKVRRKRKIEEECEERTHILLA
jgi:hypothetical protein